MNTFQNMYRYCDNLRNKNKKSCKNWRRVIVYSIFEKFAESKSRVDEFWLLKKVMETHVWWCAVGREVQ